MLNALLAVWHLAISVTVRQHTMEKRKFIRCERKDIENDVHLWFIIELFDQSVDFHPICALKSKLTVDTQQLLMTNGNTIVQSIALAETIFVLSLNAMCDVHRSWHRMSFASTFFPSLKKLFRCYRTTNSSKFCFLWNICTVVVHHTKYYICWPALEFSDWYFDLTI